MSFFSYQDTAEDSDEGHNFGQNKGEPVTVCVVKDHSSHVSPETATQVMNGRYKT